MYRSQAHHYYKPNPNHARVRKFWQIYRKIKAAVGIAYDISSVLIVLLSFDRVYKLRSWRVIKPWQIATLVQRLPKLLRTLRHNFTYGL